jgi:hypothetical protein
MNIMRLLSRQPKTIERQVCRSGAMQSIEPGISRFPDAQLRI